MRRTALRRMRIAYALRRMRCVSLRRCVVLRRRMLCVVFRFVSALRCDVASAFRFVLRCISYCVESVSRIALRFVEALRVAFHFVLR